MRDHVFSHVTWYFDIVPYDVEISRDMGKIMNPHRKIHLSLLIIVGYQKFWVFSKVKSTCVSLAHKSLGKNEILFKKFSNENENLDYFRKFSSSNFSISTMKIGKFSISDIRYVSNLFVFGQTSLLIKMKVIRALFRMALTEKWLLLNFGGMKLLTSAP